MHLVTETSPIVNNYQKVTSWESHRNSNLCTSNKTLPYRANRGGCSLACIVSATSLILSGILFCKRANAAKHAFLKAKGRVYSSLRSLTTSSLLRQIQINRFSQLSTRRDLLSPGVTDDGIRTGQKSDVKSRAIRHQLHGLAQLEWVIPNFEMLSHFSKVKERLLTKSAIDRSAVDKKKKLEHEVTTDEISLQ